MRLVVLPRVTEEPLFHKLVQQVGWQVIHSIRWTHRERVLDRDCSAMIDELHAPYLQVVEVTVLILNVLVELDHHVFETDVSVKSAHTQDYDEEVADLLH